MASAQDQQCLALLHTGDRDGLITAYDNHAPACFALAGALTPDRVSAEEVVFQAFRQLWHRPPRRADSLRSWLEGRVIATALSTRTSLVPVRGGRPVID